MQYAWLDVLSIMPEISEWFYRFLRPKELDEGTKKKWIETKDEAMIHRLNLKDSNLKRYY